MPKEEALEVDGVVLEALKNGFRVEVTVGASKAIVLATLGGKLRKNYIKVIPGDLVRVELSPYDMTKGRITFRNK